MMRLVLILYILFVSTNAELPSEIQSRMNPNIDPCHDFYQYTCGGWLESHSLQPTDIRLHASFDMIDHNNGHIFKEILNENHPILGEFWDSCLNMKTITNLGNQPLQHDLTSLATVKTKYELMMLVGTFAHTRTYIFNTLEVRPDTSDATIYTLQMDPVDLISDTFEAQEKIMSQYHVYINDLMTLSGFPLHSNKPSDIVISIEKKLAYMNRHQRDEAYYISITKAKTFFPLVFGAFIKGFDLLEKAHIDHDYEIFITDTMYLYAVEKWLSHVSLDDLKVYVAYRFIHNRVLWLGKDFYLIWFQFFEHTLHGVETPYYRSTFCVEQALKLLPDLIGEHYYNKAFDRHNKENVFQMLRLIQHAMEQHMSKTMWLDPKDENKAKNKLNNIKFLIGQTTIPKSYPSLLSRFNYPSNVYKILSYAVDLEMNKIGQHVNRMEWDDSAAEVNAYYWMQKNSIVFPAAILQPPLYNGEEIHPARNFGAIGTTMGHELTHGFDTNGRQYDSDGTLREWWSETTTVAYQKLAKCFQDQYSNFQVKGEDGNIGNVNGQLTLNENIADTGGLALAWDAYNQYMKTSSSKKYDKEEGDQMFFIAFGQMWCSKMRDDTMRTLLYTGPHAPSQWRVNGAVMNNEAFAKVFKCKVNTPMNPSIDRKCKIW